MNELNTLIERLVRLSYLRGINIDNPIDFRMQPNGSTDPTIWIILSSLPEPTYARTPYNVLWLVMNPSDNNYGKLLRRRNHEANSFNYRSEWEIISELPDAYTEVQYYRAIVEDMSLYGIDDPNINIPPASTIELGIVKLAASPNNTVYPIGILENDPRMEDDRYPTDHVHPNYARSMIKINSTNYALIDSSTPPSMGMILFLEVKHPTLPNVFLAKWRFPYESDIAFVDRSLVRIEIQGPLSVNEQSSANYVVIAHYADATSKNITPDTWTITVNPLAASIDRLTGILSTNNITTSTNITMSATYTEDGKTVSDTHIVNITAGLELESLEIIGADSVASGSTTNYSVRASFSDGSQSVVPANSFTTSNAKTSITAGPKLVVEQVFANSNTVLNASYTFDGITLTAEKTVQIVATQIVPVSITVSGDTQLNEGAVSNTYTYMVHYNDGSSAPVVNVNTLTLNKPTVAQIQVPNKIISTMGSITQDTTVRLTASYTENSTTVTGYIDILIVNVIQVTPTGMKIRITGGPDANASSHNENQNITVQYLAEFSDNVGTWVDVSTDPQFTASILAPTNGTSLSVDKLTMTLPEVTGNKTATIQASIIRNGVTKSANYVVTVIDTTVYLTDFRVRLQKSPNAGNSSTEDENQTLNLVYSALYSDAPSTWVTILASNPKLVVSLTNPNGATLAADKTSITLPEVTGNKTVIINASFEDAGKTETDTYTITMRDTTVTVTGMRIRLATAPNAATNRSTHLESQTINVQYQVEYSNAVGVWASINGNAGLTSVVVAPDNGVTFSGSDITKVVLPNVTGNKTATIRGTFTNNGTPLTADYIFDISDVVITLLELRVRLESDPSAISASSPQQDENQTIRLIYRARFSDAPTTWIDVSTDPKLTAVVQAPNLGVTLGTDKRNLIIPDMTSDSSVIVRGTYTLNTVVTVADYTVNIKNVSVGPSISPRYGKAPVQAYIADYGQPAFYSLLTTGNLTGVNGEEITTGNSADQQELWFMMYPKAWGYIYIVNKGNGFAGSWDGGKITTQDGSFGSPGEVNVNGTDYYIYRVTFPYGPGPITWKVTYGSSSPDSGML